MKKSNNPVVAEVQDRFNGIQKLTEMFLTQEDAVIRGLLVSGNAGMGKTHYVKQAAFETETNERVHHVKGSSLTAAALYVLLYFNREPGDVLVLDDVDILGKSGQELSTILDLFKGATEPTKGERILGWQRASNNQLMRDNNVPNEFDFQGAIVWITNDRIEDIAKRTKGHWNAISSRFIQSKVWLNDQEKLMYTLHLIEEENILGQDCEAKEGGFSEEVIQDVIKYVRANYRSLRDITPRSCIMIASLRDMYPDNWTVLCDNQMMA